MTTFDRYLLRRFWHVFAIGFCSTVGLFVIFDGFTNMDAFQERAGSRGPAAMFGQMVQYYGCQSVLLFDLVGPILSVVATMVVFALLQKNREIYPILSAGVPTYRLVVPLLIGAMSISGLMMVNQEFLLPAVAGELLRPIGTSSDQGQSVVTRRDFATNVEISGKRMLLAERTLQQAEFLLPAPEMVLEITRLKSDRAVYQRPTANRPGGWRLLRASPSFDELRLTEAGREVVLPLEDASELFVVTDLGCEQLLGSATVFRYQSTPELTQRLRNPSVSVMTARSQALHLHERLTRPLSNLFAVCLAVPFVLRKESFSLISNLAICTIVMIALLAIGQATQYMGRVNWMRQDLAVWLPIIVSGGLTAWYSDRVQT